MPVKQALLDLVSPRLVNEREATAITGDNRS